MSILLYCNFSDFCTEFSKTFRAIHAYETLTSIKERNRKYRHLSKILRETVQLFGELRNHHRSFRGPFYTGISYSALFLFCSFLNDSSNKC